MMSAYVLTRNKCKYFVTLLCLSFLLMASEGCNMTSRKAVDALITGYDDFGSAELDITGEEMKAAGFVPGDILSVSIGGDVLELPYHTGFFTKIGEMLVVDYPTYEHIVIAASSIGVKEKYKGLAGQRVTLKLKEKGGALSAETALGLKYSNERGDYSSDAEFANARMIGTTGIAKNRLYRSASPFDNQFGRAPYVSAYLNEHGVKTVLNLTDNEEKISRYKDIPEYSRQLIANGDVVFCKINANYRSDDFNAKLISGFIKMAARPAPYVIHCTEGKDRTGYACALLEALAGASYDEIVADYLASYRNYFGITPDDHPAECRMLLSLRLNDALLYYCGITDESMLGKIDLREAVIKYLLAHDMTRQQIDDLLRVLCD